LFSDVFNGSSCGGLFKKVSWSRGTIVFLSGTGFLKLITVGLIKTAEHVNLYDVALIFWALTGFKNNLFG